MSLPTPVLFSPLIFFYRLHPKAPDQKCRRELQLRYPVANPRALSEFRPLNCWNCRVGLLKNRQHKFRYHISEETDVFHGSTLHILINLFPYSSFNPMTRSFLLDRFQVRLEMFISQSSCPSRTPSLESLGAPLLFL